MDRDYTKDAEQEILVDISNISGLNSQFQFSTSYQGLGVQEPINGSSYFSLYQSDNSTFYGNMHGSHIPNAFERVRNYDATAAGMGNGTTLLYYSFSTTSAIDMVSGHSGSLSAFKSNLEKARDALKVSEAGYGVTNIINALSENDDIANGSIFGDSYEYAKDIEEKGFKEEAGRSNAYYKDALDRVFDVENGVVTYDMDEVKAILSKDADDITEAEYYAVSLAFTYMGEDDMESTICLLMGEGVDHDCTWTQENFGHQKDYTEWHLDEDKYEGFCNGLNNVSNQNLLTINILDYTGADTGDDTYRDLANAENDRRYVIVQRCALINSLSNVESFRAKMGDAEPDINIEFIDNRAIKFQFYEWGLVSGSNYGQASTLRESSIVIGGCNGGVCTDLETTETVKVATRNHFADGFNSEGFENSDACAKFWISHIWGFGGDVAHTYVSNGISESVKSVNNIAGEAVPYVDVLFTNVMNGIADYDKGVNDAIFLDDQEVKLDSGNAYNVFGIDTCYVTYDIKDHHGEGGLYAQAGRDTVARVASYDCQAGKSYSIDYIINNPSEMIEEFNELIHDGRGELLENVSKTSYYDSPN